MGHGVGRREFLVGLLATAGAAACGSSDGGTATESTTTTEAAAPPPELSGPPFTLGVASGDPLADRVILWTRLAPDPLAVDGGMPDVDVDVEWEVATDDTFSDIVARGVATATPALAHTVHVDATGLDPDTWYAYRFRVGEDLSPVGRTRTFPEESASPDRLRLAVTNCQDYQHGRYAAYGDLVEQDLDVVLFLGDYIYEAPGLEDPEQALAQRRYIGGFPVTLDDFRARYAITRLDPQLATAHAQLPWIITFDDHEVINNYAGDDGALAGSGEEFLERRAAAYQAWYEHLPLRIDPPTDGEVTVHRASAFGDLARLFVIETRQHADTPPCRSTSTLDMGPGCDEQQDPERTALGAAQAEWLVDAMADSDAQWQILANPVLLAGLRTSPPEEPATFFLETWDGYPAERARIVGAIAENEVRNPVVLSGDYHASFVAQVRADPFDLESPVVAPELLASSISSPVFATDYTAFNPQIEWFSPVNGYLVCDITPTEITAEFRELADVGDPDSAVEVTATFVVEPAEGGGAPTLRRA